MHLVNRLLFAAAAIVMWKDAENGIKAINCNRFVPTFYGTSVNCGHSRQKCARCDPLPRQSGFQSECIECIGNVSTKRSRLPVGSFTAARREHRTSRRAAAAASTLWPPSVCERWNWWPLASVCCASREEKNICTLTSQRRTC